MPRRKAEQPQPVQLALPLLGSVSVSVSMPVALVASLTEKAAAEGLSRSDAFRVAVTGWVNG